MTKLKSGKLSEQNLIDFKEILPTLKDMLSDKK